MNGPSGPSESNDHDPLGFFFVFFLFRRIRGFFCFIVVFRRIRFFCFVENLFFSFQAAHTTEASLFEKPTLFFQKPRWTQQLFFNFFLTGVSRQHVRPHLPQTMTYVYDDVTYVYDDVTYVQGYLGSKCGRICRRLWPVMVLPCKLARSF